MKRNTLIAVVFCLMMITTAGAGGKSAKQDENPRHAGKSSIYFYDVEATDSHGFGQLVIDVDKRTFVFNGKDFVPSSHIELRARAEGSTDEVVFASGKVTPSGNLHIAGTWEEDDPPAEVGGYYQQIYRYVLVNNGWFVAKLACYYSTDGGVTWTESDHTDGITIGFEIEANLIDLGVPEGALVKIHAIVVGGKDRTGQGVYLSNYSGPYYCYQSYIIDGVTWRPDLYPAPYGYACSFSP